MDARKLLLYVFCFILLFGCSKCSEFQNFHVTSYYPKIFESLLPNMYGVPKEANTVVQNIIDQGKVCNIFMKNLLEVMTGRMDGEFSRKLTSLIHETSQINYWFDVLIGGKIIRKAELDDIKLSEDIFPTSRSLSYLLGFIDKDNSVNSLNLRELLVRMLRFHDEYWVNENSDCNFGTSIHQRLYEMYNCISLSIFNARVILMDAVENRKAVKYNEILQKNLTMETKNEKTSAKIFSVEKEIFPLLQKSSMKIRRCDPVKYEEGVNFAKLKNFMHTTVVGKDKRMKCENLNNTSHTTFVGTRYSCDGMIHDCWDVKINKTCFPNNSKNGRKYQAFEDENGNAIGPWNNNCTDHHVESSMAVPTIGHPQMKPKADPSSTQEKYDICACICDNSHHPETIRKFSSRRLRARHSQGVVTGIKLDIKNDEVVMKIRVGVLVNGEIDLTNHSWTPEHVLENGVDDNADSYLGYPFEPIELRYDWRSVVLDDIQGPQGTVVQGVKFVSRSDGVAINILVTKINEEGKLLPETAKWYPGYDHDNIKANKSEAVKDFHYPRVPTMSNSRNLIISKPNTYVTFRASDWAADAGQTTVPFFDIQEVVTEPPVPLAGVGMYYKGQPNSGGFIGLQLISLNHTFA